MIRPMKKTSQKASKKVLGARWKLLSGAEEDREVLIQHALPPVVLDEKPCTYRVLQRLY